MRILNVAAGAVFGLATLGGVGSSARANVIGVSSIIVTDASAGGSDSYLQVGELVATQAGTGTDVALATQGASATSFSVYGSSGPSYAIDGITTGAYPNLYVSAGKSTSEYLDVTLAGIDTLSSITIYGRTDCCASRDIYDVELLNVNGSVLFTGVIDASAGGSAGYTLALAVPEPASMAILGAGLFGIGMMRRQARR